MRFGGYLLLIFLVELIFARVLLFESAYAQNMLGNRRIKEERRNDRLIEYVDRSISVKIKSGVQAHDIKAVLDLHGASLVKDFDKLRWGLIDVPEGSDLFGVMDSLQKSPLIETVEPEVVGHASLSPNDRYFQDGHQWALLNTGQNGGTPGDDIHVTQAWDLTQGSSNVLVVILDSGIPMINGSLCHPDLSNPNRILLGPNFSSDSWASDSDASGHGTHVAGIAAAETGNATGIAGVAGGCRVMVVKVFDQFDHYSVAQLERGVVYAVDHGAQVINFSGGGDSGSAIVTDAMAYAESHNVLVVAAAGNAGNSPVQYPAALSSTFANVIAVGATDGTDTRATYSNVGQQLTVVAPGGYGNYGSAQIYSTFPNYPTRLGDATGYGYAQGTSMATPYVTGTAALMLSVNPHLSPSQIRTAIQLSADKVSGMVGQSFSKYYGYGRLNANAAVRTIYVPEVYPTIAAGLSAAVRGQTIVLASGSYTLNSPLIIPSGVSMIINPGASLQFADGISLIVNGNLQANGATFTSTGSTDPGAWGSLQFKGSGSSSSSLINCIVEYGTQIDVINGANRVLITGCTITNGSGHGINVVFSSFFTAWGNTIANGNVNQGIVISGGSNNVCWGNVICKYDGTPGYHNGVGILYIASNGVVTRNDIDRCKWGIGGIVGSDLNSNWSYGSPRNNRITNCMIGVCVYGNSQCDLGKFAGGSDNGNGNNSIYGNLLFNVEVGNAINDPSRVYADDNWWGTNPPQSSKFDQWPFASTLTYDHWWTHDNPWGGQPLPASSTQLSGNSGVKVTTSMELRITPLSQVQMNIEGGRLHDSLLVGHRMKGTNNEYAKYLESSILGNPDDYAGYEALYGLADSATIPEIIDFFKSNRPKAPKIHKLLLANLYQMDGKPDLAEQENNDLAAEELNGSLGVMAEINNMRIELDSKGNVEAAGEILSRVEELSRVIDPMELADAEQAFRTYVDPTTGEMPNIQYHHSAGPGQVASNAASGNAGLMTNYPNPFNASTIISYQLSKKGPVILVVVDVLGRSVSTLVRQTQEAGVHSASFDGSRLASGIYFYQLTAPGIRQVKKMLLTK
ncbi:MAG: S8 family serine peptidase [Bacteroidota bacterium]